MQNRYSTLASLVYNLDKPVGRSFGDVEYYRERLAGCSGIVLEPAVGNGRVYVPLREAGIDVVGFDASEEMLAYCRQECSGRNIAASLTCQTFEAFDYEQRFSAAIIPAGSFQLITEADKAIAFLKRIHDHLQPGGKLILDIDGIGGFLSPTGAVRSWKTADGDLLTLIDHRAETDFVSQTTLSYLRYERWTQGRLLDTELDLFALRWWGVQELTLALHTVGFSDIVVSGGYVFGQAPAKNAETITFEARRDR
ncbi:MAG: class I SAM-dependent methyltransferase [Shinella sp.]|uniref:class I SAM-dependent methyltransferase n=1 Tax=Shinella sp. TaxID=1870904 RepID=UPI003C781B04